MIRQVIPAFCILFLVVCAPSSSLTAGDYFIKLYGENISLYAEETPLKDLLKELGRQGIRIRIDPLINPRVSASFVQKPIDRVLASILRSYNYSLVWEKKGDTVDSPLYLVELQIFERGGKKRIQLLEQHDTLDLQRGGDGRLYVNNTLLIRLNQPVTNARLQQILSSIGATITESFPGAGIIRLHLPDSIGPHEAAELLNGHDEISMAEPDYAYSLEENQKLAVDGELPEPKLDTSRGAGTPVAVLDSGLLEKYASRSFVDGVYDALANTTITTDSVGHGTQMSLVASGVVDPIGADNDGLRNNSIIAVRAFDENGFTSNATLMRSIDYAIRADARIVSMSWGSENQSPMLEQVVTYATGNGLIMVAAAGNTPTGRPVYPAAYPNVIGVGALMPDGSVWDQSNYGEFVSVYAPGVARMPVGHNGGSGTYAGTSISTAYIAHRIAQVLVETPDADIETIISNLNSSN